MDDGRHPNARSVVRTLLLLPVALFDCGGVTSGDDGPGIEMPRRRVPAGR
ncbi:hypothetical protein RCH07_001591, partial [Arthrobacter sp. CG_A4]|nr:hypothetical protein [Arthrobacter sp. CG_A4]